MARKKAKALADLHRGKVPLVWLSVDPAAGKKPTLAVLWHCAKAQQFIAVDHNSAAEVNALLVETGAELVVMESGGYLQSVMCAQTRAVTVVDACFGLERTRTRFATIARLNGLRYIDVTPAQWRTALLLPTKPRKAATQGMRTACELYARAGTQPHCELFAEATNDDKRAALLLGYACALQWGWL